MILHPAVIALIVSSLLMSALVLSSAWQGFIIFRAWDITSGSELQLRLERRTYLISMVLAYVFAFQLVSLFLYVYTADNLCTLFTGAMCAAGTLAVNPYGYPVLLLKVLNFFLAGLWLILNHADNRAPDYPLIRIKYLLLLLIAPFITAEALFQARYFLGLRPDVITSCCGSLFSGANSVASDIASFPIRPMIIIFALFTALAAIAGFLFVRTARGGYVLAFLSGALFPVTAASILSFISLYIYALPTHHCPFCILQMEYSYVGYFLYGLLFGASLSGLGVGILMPFRRKAGLAGALSGIQKKLALTSAVFALLLGLLVLVLVVTSPVRLLT